ncbi:unnamed protein product [Rotaria sp. Silwood2]|nr:unnamed protein product [Rotaria sp. Silwood2]CAF4313639.1 unnamed protein product [Rotaria sp. Silwood2]CAF4352045.1 unnamed protein product [Rotaria sp. Silwood2]
MGSVSSVSKSKKMHPSPFELMWRAKRERATSFTYVPGQASDFYFFCRNGKIHEVRQVLDAEDSPSIEQLNELQPNGSTALHAATYYEHLDIVKLLLDRNCPCTQLNRFGRTAYEEARSPEMKQLFTRPDLTCRFHELDAAHAIAVYLPEENDRDSAAHETQHFVQVFQTEEEIFQYALNQQTTAMWLKFYNWFTHTFRVFIEREDFHIDQFDLMNHGDFQQFLKSNLSNPVHYQFTIKLINEAQRRNSIEPLITLYTCENAGFYRPLNQQLSRSTTDAAKSSHLCDRFILEFFIYRHELKQRAFTGTVYRGATLPEADLAVYEQAWLSNPSGALGLKAFTSTSTDPLVALRYATLNPPAAGHKNVLFVFEIQKITPTIFGIEDISRYIQEHEVLILPGNLFIVTNIQEDPGLHVITINLRHWHVPVSFWDRIKQTCHAGRKSTLGNTTQLHNKNAN